MSAAKRSFGAISGSGSTSGSDPKKAKPMHSFFAPPSASTAPRPIAIPNTPASLEHWLWLDPFSKTLDAGDIAGLPHPSASSSSSTLLTTTTTTTASSSTSEIVDLTIETETTTTQPIASSSKGGSSKIKLALFDLDGTLIRTASGAVMPKDDADWVWLYPGDGEGSVKGKMKAVWREGYHLVIISNQKITSPKNDRTLAWRKKIGHICAELPGGMPLRALAATADNQFRKPRIGMFKAVREAYAKEGLEIDMESSFYVGDAAGRRGDHSDGDRKFAYNAGLRFFTPEQYFKDSKADPGYRKLSGFDAAAYLDKMEYVPEVTPTTSPIVPKDTKEIVLFVGPPAAGKTSFFKRHFAGKGYTWVNQDTLKSRDKCLAVVRESIGRGKGCVVDNTNRDRSTRRLYVQVAKEAGVPIRCFHFTASDEVLKHNNAHRAWSAEDVPGQTRRTLIPASAFFSYANAFEKPSEGEGFSEIRSVNFKFDGTDAEREAYCKWLH